MRPPVRISLRVGHHLLMLIKRLIILLHRYLGIALCLLVSAWCLSGMVMMYVPFPSFSTAQRIASLAPLNFTDCCALNAAGSAVGEFPVQAFELEMLAARPILRLLSADSQTLIDLRSGAVMDGISPSQAQAIVLAYLRQTHAAAAVHSLGVIERDQWTVSEGYARSAPFYLFALSDAAATQLYVSSQSGEIAQRTTRSERLWNYFGAVTHWLYPTLLRRHAAAWTQSVIWLSLAGVFLSATGLYLGLQQLRWPRNALGCSPYRGLNLWHHLSGVLFGLLTLGWVGSGFLSMNPWGLLESRYGADEQQRLHTAPLTSAQALELTGRFAHSGSAAVQQLSSAPWGESLFVLASREGTRQRWRSTDFTPAPLTPMEFARTASSLAAGRGYRIDLIERADDYYYSDHERGFEPAYRMVLNDAQHSRYYFDRTSGALLLKYDRAARAYRWAFNAVHRWDFSAGVRRRPLWDILMLTLLLGVTASSLTGVALGFRRLTH